MPAAGTSWGRYPRATNQQIVALHDRSAAVPPHHGACLAFGNGRSYGDVCLNSNGALLHTAGLDRFIHFDAQTGVIECEAGVQLHEVLALAVPQGWFLPVTPGTQYVTLGGAVANDVHGKNHTQAGSLGSHVLGFELLRTDGSRRWCTPDDNADWFAASIGGLGLTGLIVRVRLQLRRIASPWMQVETQRFAHLQAYFQLVEHALKRNEHVVAWVDCLAKGPQLGRGILMRADHAPALAADRPEPTRGRRLAMPVTPPLSLVNGLSLRVFNALYYRRAPARPRQSVAHYTSFFYPLDGIAQWNRMYGPDGFVQYQCVVPPQHAAAATEELLATIAASKQGSFLIVLKQFGAIRSPGLLSFPREGTTLALDFPMRGATTLRLLDTLDRIVIEVGGAVYPAKDARMPPRVFAASFPRLPEFLPYVDPGFSSDLWRRVSESP